MKQFRLKLIIATSATAMCALLTAFQGCGPGLEASAIYARPPSDDAISKMPPLPDLETQIHNLADSTTCRDAGDCDSKPVGVRACGGPSWYIPFSTRGTSNATLTRLDSLIADYNREAEALLSSQPDMVSTCEYRMPPTLTCLANRCVIMP